MRTICRRLTWLDALILVSAVACRQEFPTVTAPRLSVVVSHAVETLRVLDSTDLSLRIVDEGQLTVVKAALAASSSDSGVVVTRPPSQDNTGGWQVRLVARKAGS